MTAKQRRWALGLGALAALALVGLTWLGLAARSAYSELTASRADLESARQALSETDLESAAASVASAAEHASAAAEAVETPAWDLAAAVPGLGSTPRSIRAIATALDQALSTLAPASEHLAALDPSSLLQPGGTIDLAALSDAVAPLTAARGGMARASQTLADASPTTSAALVPDAVAQASAQLADQLAAAESTLDNAVTACTVIPRLLGANDPKRYFVAILNPNEARGIGGFLGTFAILRADAGRISVERVGSNSDLTSFAELPIDLGKQYRARYGDHPALVANMNISPHYPDAAKLWLASWEATTGEQLDGAFSVDVVALGRMVSATGSSVPLPDGGAMTGAQLTSFAISGIYERFPQAADSAARKAYQEAVTAAGFDVVTRSSAGRELATAVQDALAQRRLLLWSRDPMTQQALLDAGLAGSLRVDDGHTVDFVAINASGSKLDAYLQRTMRYEVGRCVAEGRVHSRVTVGLTNQLPAGSQVPQYMVSLARRGPTGPVNSTLAQFHLPNGSQIDEVHVDGTSVGFAEFTEQGRVTALLLLQLPPGEQRSVSVEFTEPAHDGPGRLPPQPLGDEPQTTILEVGC